MSEGQKKSRRADCLAGRENVYCLLCRFQLCGNCLLYIYVERRRSIVRIVYRQLIALSRMYQIVFGEVNSQLCPILGHKIQESCDRVYCYHIRRNLIYIVSIQKIHNE